MEVKEIGNTDDPNTDDCYITTRKDSPADFMNSFDQSKHHSCDQREEEDKRNSKCDDVS